MTPVMTWRFKVEKMNHCKIFNGIEGSSTNDVSRNKWFSTPITTPTRPPPPISSSSRHTNFHNFILNASSRSTENWRHLLMNPKNIKLSRRLLVFCWHVLRSGYYRSRAKIQDWMIQLVSSEAKICKQLNQFTQFPGKSNTPSKWNKFKFNIEYQNFYWFFSAFLCFYKFGFSKRQV